MCCGIPTGKPSKSAHPVRRVLAVVIDDEFEVIHPHRKAVLILLSVKAMDLSLGCHFRCQEQNGLTQRGADGATRHA